MGRETLISKLIMKHTRKTPSGPLRTVFSHNLLYKFFTFHPKHSKNALPKLTCWVFLTSVSCFGTQWAQNLWLPKFSKTIVLRLFQEILENLVARSEIVKTYFLKQIGNDGFAPLASFITHIFASIFKLSIPIMYWIITHHCIAVNSII